jgi:probable phosphoglycerate mutase
VLVLVRHGETAWSRAGKHTGRTDVPLTAAGRARAGALRDELASRAFGLVLSSPSERALDTARRAGFGDVVEIDDDLAEWDYGDFEGRTTAEIRRAQPGWTLWASGVPNGETAAAVAARAARVLARADDVAGDVLVFSHGHLLRVLATRWLGLDVIDGRLLALAAGSVSELGWEREQRVLTSWNLVG